MDFINNVAKEELVPQLLRVCHSQAWAEAVFEARPFEDEEELKRYAEEVWNSVSEDEWLEAFRGHPRIGDVDALRAKFTAAKDSAWESGEQSGAADASEEVLHELKRANEEYEERFGFIFLVCATGKTAPEMLEILRGRYPNDRDAELVVAAGEQNKITMLRLDKLIAEHKQIDR